MKTRKKITSVIMVMAVLPLFISMQSCKEDQTEEAVKGKVNIHMTDAVSDDAKVEAVFVTVAGVMVDGQLLQNFEKQTVEISAYTNGRSVLLAEDDIEVGAHSEIQLMLDFETDANGESPGAYVMTEGGVKHDLNSSGELDAIVQLNESFEVSAGQTSEIIVDLDLRKSVKRDENSTADDEYEFVAEADFESAFRISETQETGTIEGELDGNIEAEEQVVVYAYKKGTYAESETSGEVKFKNAETSAMVDASGNYTLAFLEEGEYEIVAASYVENASGQAEFKATLDLEVWLNGLLSNSIKVNGQSETSLMLKLL